MNYFDTLIEVADDCPTKKAQVPLARGGKKTKAVVEYEILVKHPYSHTEEDIAFETYAVLHDFTKGHLAQRTQEILKQGPSAPAGVAADKALRLGHSQQRCRQNRADR